MKLKLPQIFSLFSLIMHDPLQQYILNLLLLSRSLFYLSRSLLLFSLSRKIFKFSRRIMRDVWRIIFSFKLLVVILASVKSIFSSIESICFLVELISFGTETILRQRNGFLPERYLISSWTELIGISVESFFPSVALTLTFTMSISRLLGIPWHDSWIQVTKQWWCLNYNYLIFSIKTKCGHIMSLI